MSDKGATTGEVRTSAEVTAQGDRDHAQTAADLSPYVENHDQDAAKAVLSFAIEDHERNTAQRPDHESTNLIPILVRRIDSQEILPRPYRSTNELLAASYLSILCCMYCAAFAVQHAYDAKIKRNAGHYTSAIGDARCACRFLVGALVAGTFLWIAGIVLLIMYHLQEE